MFTASYTYSHTLMYRHILMSPQVILLGSLSPWGPERCFSVQEHQLLLVFLKEPELEKQEV